LFDELGPEIADDDSFSFSYPALPPGVIVKSRLHPKPASLEERFSVLMNPVKWDTKRVSKFCQVDRVRW
jgi:hypothetical protein